ncbi:MAG: UDP-N-acetylmuramoyl-L-alanine--D-glutamate ligase, partial [Alphaproteobacteria bacterium]|nr:UDP-N-acetylmuramoyl-L-alanine--D-glutamate ligase [Alphaproteobacteria bacterium]
RHGDLAGYVKAKERILRPRNADSLAIIGTDTNETADIANQMMIDGRAVSRIAHNTQPTSNLIDAGECPALAGDHGKQNAAAAFAIAQALGLSQESILDGLRSFPGLAHRQERIATLDGVIFINDSKATNADSAARALSAFEGIYWIAGGKGKDGGYGALDSYLPRVRHAFLIGDAAKTIADWIGKRVPITLSGTMENAVDAAYEMARKEHAPGPVILSPACASFDQFKNFEVRGDAFRALVLSLPSKSRTVFSTREAA